MEKEKLVFGLNERGFTLKVWYLVKGQDALVEIFKGENKIMEFTFPAYKIYNLYAHFSDIVDTEIYKALPPLVKNSNYKNGYSIASW